MDAMMDDVALRKAAMTIEIAFLSQLFALTCEAYANVQNAPNIRVQIDTNSRYLSLSLHVELVPQQ